MSPVLSLLEKVFGSCTPEQAARIRDGIQQVIAQGVPQNLPIPRRPSLTDVLQHLSGITIATSGGYVGQIIPPYRDQRIYVMALTLSTSMGPTSPPPGPGQVGFLDSGEAPVDPFVTSGVLLWSHVLCGIPSADLLPDRVVEAVSYPSFLFRTNKDAGLYLYIQRNAGWVTWSLTYWTE